MLSKLIHWPEKGRPRYKCLPSLNTVAYFLIFAECVASLDFSGSGPLTDICAWDDGRYVLITPSLRGGSLVRISGGILVRGTEDRGIGRGKVLLFWSGLVLVALLQVKIKFRLKFFMPGWFSVSFCVLTLIIHELGLGDKGNLEST